MVMIRVIVAVVFLNISLLYGCKQGQSTDKGAAAPSADYGLEIGNKAPDLEFKSPDGKTISLSSLRGKIVLIDFWASWCLPCRIENPNVVRVYQKYKDKDFERGKGFTIYSVSLDTKQKSWVEAIDKDGLVWESHVSDLSGWNSAVVSIYQISAIPSNYLINGDGIIIDKNLRAEALENKINSLIE